MMQLHTLTIVSYRRTTSSHALNIFRVKCIIPLASLRVISAIAPMISALGAPTFAVVAAQIMNKNTACTNVVSMEVLDLEVEDLNRFGQLFTTDGIDKCIFTVLELQLVVQLQILRGKPALTLHIEGMLGGTGDGFAIDLYMYQFILLVQEGADDTLECAFTSLGIFRPDHRAQMNSKIILSNENEDCQ